MCNARGLAVIIPARDAARTLPACLQALAASDLKPDEILLFDDGSSDATADIARTAGLQVIGNTGRAIGPGQGRNRAALQTRCPFLAFVDADVAVHPGALQALYRELDTHSGVAAAFGSYDDKPACSRLAARYVNLRHHQLHQSGEREAHTFWSGLGMVRREAFLAVGGFAPSFDRPSVEDIELGIRLLEAGHRVRLVPDALGTHWKDWRLIELWKTDILRRALPWSRLIVAQRTGASTLNVSRRERVAAAFAIATLASLFGVGFWPAFAWLAGFSLVTWSALNRRFLWLLLRRGGIRLLLGGGALHLAYHLYASATFAFARLEAMLRGKRSGPATTSKRGAY